MSLTAQSQLDESQQGEVNKGLSGAADLSRVGNSSLVLPDFAKITTASWQQQLQQLVECPISASERHYWMVVLRQWLVVNQPMDLRLADDVSTISLNMMCNVAYKLCDWPLIIQIRRLLPLVVQAGEQQNEAYALQLAVAYWQMGQLSEAERFLAQLLPPLPADHPLLDFHHHITQEIARMPFGLGQGSGDSQDGDVCLIPLEEQHLSDFSWVYQDPQIAKLCNLPQFSDDEQWYNWLDRDQVNPHKHTFAVIHRQWGFVGSVAIEIHDGVGFFYYWLGQDFQGQGLGPQAVLLLLRLASSKLNMTCCFAKVFNYNIPSQKALTKMGFIGLPFTVSAPNDDQKYYYYGPQQSLEQLGEQLQWIAKFTDVDNEINIVNALTV